jgi:ubiquinone/menaquinone biosynthesis C-methylase UbiE
MMEMKELAEQLRLPHGENSKIVTELMAKSNRNLYEYTYKCLGLIPKAEVLEIGPADGHFINDLFKIEKNIVYTGVDLSDEMIQAANENHSELIRENKVKFIKGDVVSLPFSENSFDRIFTVNTLYFWSDPGKGVCELLRVLKPSGKIFVIIRSKDSMEKMPFTQYGFEMYSIEELTRLFSENGFPSVSISLITETVDLPSGGTADMVSFCAMAEKM